MAEFEWRDSDSTDLVRRDRLRLVQQGGPVILASGLLAVWLRSTAPGWAAAFLGMSIAWIASVATQLATFRSRWRALQMGPLRVQFGDEGITWQASHGSRLLRWDALEVRQLGNTWLLLVKGHEAGYLPKRCLDATEASRLTKHSLEVRS
jgi:hypothetical protein